MKEQLKTLRQRLRENPASFTTAEKAFLRCILTRDDELGNIRYITKEFVNLLDNPDMSPWSLVKWTSNLVAPEAYENWKLADKRENDGLDFTGDILFWNTATATLEKGTGNCVTVDGRVDSALGHLKAIIARHN